MTNLRQFLARPLGWLKFLVNLLVLFHSIWMAAMSKLSQYFGRPPRWVKFLVSMLVLFHFSAIFSHVLSGGGPYVMRLLSSYYRPYLKTIWMDNAYRFYAPDPGPTEVIWYRLLYEDGTTRWTQLPRREDFYFRITFQRHMSIALLAAQMNQPELVKPKDDAASVASVLTFSVPSVKTMLTPIGEIYFRSYARHLGRKHLEHPKTQAKLIALDCYFVHYLIRTPNQMRENLDMFDPRLLKIEYIATFTPTGVMSNFEQGFRERVPDDFFVEIMQNEILPLLEANQKLPVAERQPIMKLLEAFGIPHPLIQPLYKFTPEELEEFFKKPYDRDTLRERYAKIVKRDDKPLPTANFDPVKTGDDKKVSPTTNDKPAEKIQRGVQ